MSWDDTKRLIRGLVDEFRSSNSESSASVRECLALSAELEDRLREVTCESQRIQSKLEEATRSASSELRSRSRELVEEMGRASALEDEMEDLRRMAEELTIRTEEVGKRAEGYRAEVDEAESLELGGAGGRRAMTDLQGTEFRHMAEMRKIRHQVKS